MRSLGARAIFCNHNLFIDESVFDILPVQKRYDAVYNATLTDVKRPQLAAEIRSLRFITATPDNLNKLSTYGLSGVAINDRYLAGPEVSEILNQCRCGLALSEKEGPMIACTEYLLCGLPVVSTPAMSGRVAWYTERNHIICEPNAHAVAQAVDQIIRDSRDPRAIRDDAVKLSRRFRRTLAECVQSISGYLPYDENQITGTWFAQNFVQIHFMKEFFNSYDGHRFTRRDLLGKRLLASDLVSSAGVAKPKNTST